MSHHFGLNQLGRCGRSALLPRCLERGRWSSSESDSSER